MLKTVCLKSISRGASLLFVCLLAACGGGSDPASPSIASPDTRTQGSSETQAAADPPSTAPAITLNAASTCGVANFQAEILARVNRARSGSRMCGDILYNPVPPLTWNTSLFNAAAGHSSDMASANFFSHTSLDGRSFAQRISQAGYAWSTIGENLAAGQSGIDDVINLWMSSPGHCANIMSGNFSEIGLACAVSVSAMYSSYWTMDLGHP